MSQLSTQNFPTWGKSCDIYYRERLNLTLMICPAEILKISLRKLEWSSPFSKRRAHNWMNRSGFEVQISTVADSRCQVLPNRDFHVGFTVRRACTICRLCRVFETRPLSFGRFLPLSALLFRSELLDPPRRRSPVSPYFVHPRRLIPTVLAAFQPSRVIGDGQNVVTGARRNYDNCPFDTSLSPADSVTRSSADLHIPTCRKGHDVLSANYIGLCSFVSVIKRNTDIRRQLWKICIFFVVNMVNAIERKILFNESGSWTKARIEWQMVLNKGTGKHKPFLNTRYYWTQATIEQKIEMNTTYDWTKDIAEPYY